MESEDSRPGSSASNSSSNSEQSLPYNNSEEKQKAASPASSSRSRGSRRSGSINEGSQRSQSKSDSDSSSSSSSENDDDEDNKFDNAQALGSPIKGNETGENDEIHSSNSPRRSTRGSSTSSNPSRNNSEERHNPTSEMNMSHEDLSDVSDLESEKRESHYNNSKQSMDDESTNGVDDASKDQTSKNSYAHEDTKSNSPLMDLRQKLEMKKNLLNNNGASTESDGKTLNGKSGMVGESLEDLVKTHDDDALDFEAEEGECNDVSKDEDKNEEKNTENSENANSSPKTKPVDDEELEEGEVSDEDDKRPEETEPKPVCRFYTRGQCTWGMSCRFLHPGVKGNYTMFDLVRPVPLLQGGTTGSRASGYNIHSSEYHDYRTERPSLHHRSAIPHVSNVFAPAHETRPISGDGPVVVESAWERGLRTAKEMMRKANKRKEQDMDFEDKKMHLTLSPDELEKDPYYAKDRLSPAEVIRHPLYPEAVGDVYGPAERYNRGPPASHYDDIDPYGRSARYRELPPHRMPQYEDDRRVRPTREVIVQRVEPVGRGDEWNDPWMRSKSPGGRGSSRDRGDKRRRDRRSYSSNSSYSSSSSSQSDSSSDSSRSLSSRDHHRRRYASNSHKSPTSRRTGGRSLRSPSLSTRRSRRTPSLHHSPSSKRRTNSSLSPVYNRGNAYSPVHKKKRASPLPKKTHTGRTKLRRRHSSSSSDSVSSDSTASESESDSGSSSSGSSSRSRDNSPPKRLRTTDKTSVSERKVTKNVEVPKKRSPITIELKKPAAVGVSALASPTHSTTSERDSKKSRREELLKQLRAVEDAIAKKRSKLA
ncbi:zinc finger CCCH domain-containing protein 18-like [Musca vetustissima]|uniref:zinc finger CCCH domain-containing protein 18-like n=1 Tax=Musca vetustissima TaxID=27455 RepID=UPI002AB64E23|nr:zinc finger CCCH domain-containing protein 18-like [Musca vetustissima]